MLSSVMKIIPVWISAWTQLFHFFNGQIAD
jgi:hypothetical protein